jgi:DNA-directed RNA polymerase II subunit RPB1
MIIIYLKKEDETQQDKVQSIMNMIEHTKLDEIVSSSEICFDPDDLNTLIEEDKDMITQFNTFENMVAESKWIIRMEMNSQIMLEKNITMDDVNFVLKNAYDNHISCVFSDYNSDKLIFRIRMNDVLKTSQKSKKGKINPLDQSDQIYVLKNFQDQLLQNIILRGVKGLKKVILRTIKDNLVESNGTYKKQDIWVLDTIGTNLLSVLSLDYIDKERTFSNDIVEIYNVLGIEAARQAIYNELVDVIEFDGTYINYHNFSILVDRMTYSYKMISIFRHGINNDNIGPIAKASFEETPEMFLKAARHAELDTFKGISANVMCGQEGYFGTSAFQVVLDIEELQKLQADSYNPIDIENEVDKFLEKVDNPDDPCSLNNLTIQNNVSTIKPLNTGEDNDYNPGF